MKLFIFGATGTIGSALVIEALQRNHAVTAVARSAERLTGLPGAVRTLPIDIAKAEDLPTIVAGCDAVLSALRPPEGREADLVTLTIKVVKAAHASGVPAFVVGGAAMLLLPDQGGETVLTAPAFLPDNTRPIAEACAALEDALAECRHADWTLLRPSPELFDGPRTGSYVFGTDVAVTDGTGRSRISHGDFAAAMLDLVEGVGPRERILTVGWAGDAAGSE